MASRYQEPDTGPVALTRRRILDAASELVDADGVQGLKMRSLAEHLSTSPMSLYRHVATKEELLRGLAERYLEDVTVPETADLPWKDAIVATVVATREAFRSHPGLSQIEAVQHIDVASLYRLSEALLATLKRAGFSDREAVRTLDVIASYSAGHVQRSGRSVPDDRVARLLALPKDEFATLRALAAEMIALEFEDTFEGGLRVILDGVEGRRA